MREASEEKNEGARNPGFTNPEQRRRRAESLLPWRAFVSGVRSSPLLATAVHPAFLRPRHPRAELLRRLLPMSSAAGLLQKRRPAPGTGG